MNEVVVARSVLDRLSELADKGDPAARRIARAIGLMSLKRPSDPTFPGFLTVLGPLIFVTAGGYRLEIEELTSRLVPPRSGAVGGDLYVYALISPQQQEEERHELG